MSFTAGLVTLVFTDIEDGTRLWEDDRDAMAVASARTDRVIRDQVAALGGRVFQAVGDAHRAVFADPVAALSAATAIQRAVETEPWASGLPLRVRVALHSGACTERGGDYVGPVANRAARLLDVSWWSDPGDSGRVRAAGWPAAGRDRLA
jgi:class 3 adenylate cyclase